MEFNVENLCLLNLYKPNTCLFRTEKVGLKEVWFRQVSLYKFCYLSPVKLFAAIKSEIYVCKYSNTTTLYL